MSFQPTQSLIDALRLADQVSCPYERRYKKNTRYQRTQRSSIARSMPTLIEDKKIPVFNNAPRKSIGATSDLYVEKEEFDSQQQFVAFLLQNLVNRVRISASEVDFSLCLIIICFC
ncbi:hypothetical protein L3Y34_010885 [Caenorhabditis briggsae]|uniref:Uncharacterized protein n=1 Tax=Caenorhabditis briggsae TaxID=6238 RepID=A0AAE8ZNQ9_CAEBR|nr:hypothetical protein L3Y34_010885 [Caenorhabditis briggsae]